MRKLTAAMIVRNEEPALPGCLDSLAGVADELAVVDTGSTDGTLGLLEAEAGRGRFERVEIRHHPFEGFGASRRRAIALADTEWILWIDADERLSPALRRELALRLDTGTIEDRDVWRLPFATHVLGRRMSCRELGGQRHARLFRRGRAEITPARVHEGLEPLAGAKVGDLDGEIIHQTLVRWRDYMAKAALYAALEAPGRSRLYAALHLPVAFPSTFWRQYLRRGCRRDGWPGFVWAATSGLGAILRDWDVLTGGRA